MNALISLSVLGVITLLAGLFQLRKLIVPIAVVGLLASIFMLCGEWNQAARYFNDMVYFDNYALVFSSLICFATILVAGLAADYHEKLDIPLAEVISLILFTVVGAVCMVSFSNITMLFLGIEILSVSLYILAGARKRDFLSNEASLKYFLMGAFATGFLLFGIALIYGITGSFNIVSINTFIAANKDQLPSIFYVGILFLIIGMGFKISAAPFQFWTPDVYTGAPSIVTVFMATVVKVAGVAAFFRLFSGAFAELSLNWAGTLVLLSALTMSIGNITAVFQSSVKRMMAYSSIAHAGYFLMAIFSMTSESASAILVYAMAYCFATILIFIGIITVQEKNQGDHFEHFGGLAKRNPLLAFGITLGLISLAGIPPAAGFFGKFYVFSTAMSKNYVWMTILAVINSCISVYYYFRVIIAMYMHPSHNGEERIELSANYKFILIVCALLVLGLGIAPSIVSNLL